MNNLSACTLQYQRFLIITHTEKTSRRLSGILEHARTLYQVILSSFHSLQSCSSKKLWKNIMKKLSSLSRQCNYVFEHLMMSLRKPHLLKFLILISIHRLNGVLFLNIYTCIFYHSGTSALLGPLRLLSSEESTRLDQIGTDIDSDSQYLDPVVFLNITEAKVGVGKNCYWQYCKYNFSQELMDL